MRKGQNPAKMGLPAYQPERLGILLVVYIPTQTGYFTDSLKILEYQIASIHKNTQRFSTCIYLTMVHATRSGMNCTNCRMKVGSIG